MLEPLTQFAGPAAALITSVLWAFTALFFTAAGRRIGSTLTNALRIGVAIVLLGVTHRLLSENGTWIPDANSKQVLFLGLSGVVGLTIGDWALFTAFVRVGPRVSMVIMTTSPIFAALLGWIVLDETLGPVALFGMAVTIAGVAWVVLERPTQENIVVGPARNTGIMLAFVGAACQAGGLLLSKQGIGHGWLPEDQQLAPQAATLVRMFFAGVFVVPTLLWIKRGATRVAGQVASSPKIRRHGYLLTLCGAVVGPYLGVWMSLEAANLTSLGIAQTLMSLAPVFILPLVILVHKERVSGRSIVGAAVAVAGAALLFVTSGEG